jgi:drug/metabolite transporter (DMT)-like permease
MDAFQGILFAVLWASASVAAKVGYHDAKPLTILDARFILAGALTLAIYQTGRVRRPHRDEWRHILVLGTTNSAVYLGCSWVALRHVSVGIFSLFVATNPFIVALLSRVVVKREVIRREWIGMLISAGGLALATVPSLGTARVDTFGIVLLVIAMVTYSVGTVYRGWSKLSLPAGALNAWQICVGAVLIFPVALALNGHAAPPITLRLTGALAWSVIVVSLVANVIWFHLIARDGVRASMYLFLTPLFGYVEAGLVLGERIHLSDVIGTVVVFTGLWVGGSFSPAAFARRSSQPNLVEPQRHA